MRINDDQNSLKAGERGATLLEDFQLREKIMHFDHERIPERIVHARGSGAHGYFELTESMSKYTKAKFLKNPGTRTPVFVRFSTVAGSRGSSDLARDVRGFAVKFYTEEGNYDLVGNNVPVLFIQDAIKFPDLIHAVKPEPNNEMPQAASAHDTFWDFISMTPESMHTIMWAMSDRTIPRSLRMMEGFGVHTFRFINEKNHIVNAFRFELGKLDSSAIRERVAGMLTHVDKTLASRVAEGLGIPVPKPEPNLNQNIPADGDPKKFQPVHVNPKLQISKALSMAGTVKNTIKTRQIAILAANGVDEESLKAMKQALEAAGAHTKIIASHLGFISAANGNRIKVDQSFLTAASVLFDAVYVPDGAKSADLLKNEPDAIQFINEAYKHCKAITADSKGTTLLYLTAAGMKIKSENKADKYHMTYGVLLNRNSKEFIHAIAQHRFWEREKTGKVPA